MNSPFLPSFFFNDCWQRCRTPFIIKRLLRYRQDRGDFSALLLSGDIYFLEALSLSLFLSLSLAAADAAGNVAQRASSSFHLVAALTVSPFCCCYSQSASEAGLLTALNRTMMLISSLRISISCFVCMCVCVLPFVSVQALCVCLRATGRLFNNAAA